MSLGLGNGPAAIRRRRRARPWVAVLGLSLVGCASTCGDSSDPGTIGELGNGRFLYQCGGDSDPVCEFSDPGEDFPECIVVGGNFDLEYELLDPDALDSDLALDPLIYVESVNQSFFEGDDDFTARRVGEAAFLVRETEHVLDLLHIRIVPADDFDIFTRDPAEPTSEVTVGVGDTEVFRVFPRSSECLQLGGGPTFTANSSDETIASTSTDSVLRIQGQGLGTAVVRVQLGSLEKMVTVNVVEGSVVPDTDSGTTGGSDSGSDSGSGSDTASGTDSATTDPTAGGSTGGSSTGGN